MIAILPTKNLPVYKKLVDSWCNLSEILIYNDIISLDQQTYNSAHISTTIPLVLIYTCYYQYILIL